MFVPVKRQRPLGASAEQRAVFRRIGDDLGGAFAADMTVQAQHTIRSRHHHMQIMADHQDGTAHVAAYLFDLAVKRGRAGLIQPLRRLVEDQDMGFVQQGACQQYALELAARQVGHLLFRQIRDPRLQQRLRDGLAGLAAGQVQKAMHRQRQRRVDLQLLRDIADAQVRSTGDRPRRGFQRADQRPQQARLARPVGADDGHDLAALYGDINVAQHRLPANAQGQVPGGDQAHAVAPS